MELSQNCIAVETSQGTVYVRNLCGGDICDLEELLSEPAITDQALGRVLLKRLVLSEDRDSLDVPPAQLDWDTLNENDLQALAIAASKSLRLDDVVTEDCQEGAALGASLRKFLEHQQAKSKSRYERYASLMSPTLSAWMTEATKLKLNKNLTAVARINDSLKSLYLPEAAKSIAELSKHVPALAAAAQLNNVTVEKAPLIAIPTNTAASRAAKASEDSARHLEVVAGLMSEMTQNIGGLHTVIANEVVPQWLASQAKTNEDNSHTIKQAERSLFWAKWALFVSVLMTFATTAWQLYVAREYKLESDAQQASIEKLMQQQLNALEKLGNTRNRPAPTNHRN